MADPLSFSLVQLKTGVTPASSPNAITATDLGTTTGVQNRALIGITGDGDRTLEAGETGHILLGARASNGLTGSATLNGADDPVAITVHGRISGTTVGNLNVDTALGFTTRGFGVDNGPDSNNNTLNGGDSVTWKLNAVNGVAQKLTTVSFVVDRTSATEVAIDFDGDVVNTGSYAATQNTANANAALRLASVPAGATIAINFETKVLTVNGAARTGTAITSFFNAFEASGKDTITIGGIGPNGFGVRDLVLGRAEAGTSGPNLPPTVALSNAVTQLAETTNTTAAVKVADIVVSDDGVGQNVLSLAGDDASLFEIVGNQLFLRAGTTLNAGANPRLDVQVRVDDATVGSTPDASAPLSITVGTAPTTPSSQISFGLVQLKTGVTPTSSPNVITSADLGTTTGVQNRALVGIAGDGDRTLEAGESASILLGARASNGLTGSATLNGANDPVTITVHGRINGTTVGNLNVDTALGFGTRGFGVDNGPDSANTTLNGGDSVSWKLNAVNGVAQKLTTVSFVVDRTSATEVALDFDGNVVKTGSYGATQNTANANAALRLASVPASATIAINFETKVLTVNGVARTGTAITSFFNAFETSGKDTITIGGIGPNGFGVRDLVLGRADNGTPPPDQVGDIKLDGALGDWNAGSILHTSGSYVVRGAYQADTFLVALDTGGTPIGPNTTLWLDTDLNAATGFQVFGFAVGAEFNINIGADGRPALYTGAAGQTFVSFLDYGMSADGARMEIALPSSLVGGARVANLYLDVNDTVFLPDPYASGGFRIGSNQTPTVALTPVLGQLPENADTTAAIKVADIAVTDPDGLGTNTLSLAGADAALFEIANGALYLKAGVALDFEANPSLDVSVRVDDPAIGGNPDHSANFQLGVTDVREGWGLITLDGAIGEWAAGTRLDTPTNGADGYAVRGTYDADAFLISIDTPGTAIGPNTTIWLNTDLNTGTGHQVFGFAAGAEYNVNFRADGTAALYSGGAGETLVADNLAYFLSADRTTLEIALPSSLLGGSRRADVFFDVNNSVFLPNDYANVAYRVQESTALPTDPKLRVAIVYSETSANAYFDKTAYGQLFMAAQHQAMQAGIPFDILSEADLTNVANLADYDAIVFPSLSHVQSSRLNAISEALTSAVQDYKIGLVTMGNFLTNTENGTVSGNVYARMQSLLGVTFDSSGSTSNVALRAANGNHPVTDLYSANELVDTYSNTSYATFRDVSGTGVTLFTQGVAGTSVPGVIATTTGGRNVHFASDALFGNNNILKEAIGWSARGDAPEVALEMTRGTSLFFSRNDMDQSQQAWDVIDQDPGIYDAMLPIVRDWYEDYGFVGSYYVNVGANAPDERTDWAVSRPYYQQLMGMENEIGTHSYTHPHDTNFLLDDTFTQAEWQAWVNNAEVSTALRNQLQALGHTATQSRMTTLLAQTNPVNANATDPSTLSELDRAILKGSYRFQFDYSSTIIERELGLSNIGAAVPGMPEKIAATLEMFPYVSYLSGGYSGIGAGYPGAFGFLNPANTDKVYFAPNMSFDFTLIGWLGLNPTQAEAYWADEYASVVSKGNTPIIHFPWHDYGPTNWPSEGVPDPGYRLQMFTSVIARAFADRTEFVTGADLAKRIESFVDTDIQITRSGNDIVATVTGTDAGKFALDVDTNQVIANVDGWYAFDGKKVFLPRNGGTFDITLGAQAADVTRIAELPMRAELVSLSGDGADLTFRMSGKGQAVVELQAPNGRSVVATGADASAISGERMTLTFNSLGTHDVTIDFQGGAAAMAAMAGTRGFVPQTVKGTAGDDLMLAGSGGARMAGGLGGDTLVGSAADDVFVFSGGIDRILGFDGGGDRIELVDSGFTGPSAALLAFKEVAAGVLLSLSETDRLLIRGIDLDDLGREDLVLSDSLLS